MLSICPPENHAKCPQTLWDIANIDTKQKARVDSLARKVLNAKSDFEFKLHSQGKGRYPNSEFEDLWNAVVEYADALHGTDWIHRSVAREISGLREYLALKVLKSPGKVLAKTDRMECILFDDHDPYFEGNEPPEL